MMDDQTKLRTVMRAANEVDKAAEIIIHAAEKYLARKVAGPAAFLMADNDKKTPKAALQDWELFQRHKRLFQCAPRLLDALERAQVLLQGDSHADLRLLINEALAEAAGRAGDEVTLS